MEKPKLGLLYISFDFPVGREDTGEAVIDGQKYHVTMDQDEAKSWEVLCEA